MRYRAKSVVEWASVVVPIVALAGCGARWSDARGDGGGTAPTSGQTSSTGGTGAAGTATTVEACHCSAAGCVTHTTLPAFGSNLDYPKAVLDDSNGKLLVVNPYGSAPYRPSLLRCDPDGSNCASSDVSAGLDMYASAAPLIDDLDHELLIPTTVTRGVVRCHLDGTACSYVDIAVGPSGQADYPTGLIDAENRKLLVVSMTYTDAGSLHLHRCELDGTGCVHQDISAGHASGSNGWIPVALLDPINRKLLVVAVAGTIGLFRCDLDGTNCTYADVSAGQTGAFEIPAAVIDPTNEKLLIMTARVGDDVAELIRCELDGTGCTARSIQSGAVRPSPYWPSALVYQGHLLIVSSGAVTTGASNHGPSVFACALDGSACAFTDLAAGLVGFEEYNSLPSPVIDARRNDLLTVTKNDADGKLSLFSLCLQ